MHSGFVLGRITASKRATAPAWLRQVRCGALSGGGSMGGGKRKLQS